MQCEPDDAGYSLRRSQAHHVLRATTGNVPTRTLALHHHHADLFVTAARRRQRLLRARAGHEPFERQQPRAVSNRHQPVRDEPAPDQPAHAHADQSNRHADQHDELDLDRDGEHDLVAVDFVQLFAAVWRLADNIRLSECYSCSRRGAPRERVVGCSARFVWRAVRRVRVNMVRTSRRADRFC